ncbi:EmrB/QacA subfamily drug resistance transporter [Labrenzia sp. EL_195]|nr:EmrB/QacA subfamily drug resistance transporter [Labrenzia sp. EL_195]
MLDNRKLWITIALGNLSGLVLLDETILSVALSSIREDLHLSATSTHWIVNAYMLAFTCLAAVGGKCMNIFGLRPTLIAVGTVFAGASLAAGFAQDGATLMAMRVLQGICAAIFYPISFAGVVSIYPKEEHGKAIGTLASVATVFLAAGPVLGGVIAEYVNWRWVFWINIPMVVVSVATACVVWKKLPHESSLPNVDGVGLILMLVGMLGLIFGLMEGVDYGWSNPAILVCLAIGALALAFFWRYESSHLDPLIDTNLFRRPRFLASEITILVAQFSKISIALYVPLYLIDELKFTPGLAGLSVLCAVGPFPFLSPITGRIADRHGARAPIVLGAVALMAASFAVGIAMYLESLWTLVFALVLWGVAIPFNFIAPSRLSTISVPVEKQGELSGLTITARLVGSTLGVTAGSVLLRTGLGFPSIFWLSGMLFVLIAVFCFWALRETPHGQTESSKKFPGLRRLLSA